MDSEAKNAIIQFACCYLHEDWEEDYETVEDAFVEFIHESTRDHQIELGKALAKLLEETETEKQLEKALSKLDWQVYFEDASMRDFLQEMSEALLNG